MFLRALMALLMIGVGATAQAQTDTLRRPPAPRPVAPVSLSDTARARDLRPGDLEALNAAVRHHGLGDRMGPSVRQQMRETLAAQRRIWAARRPRTYRIRTVDMSGCIQISVRRPHVNGGLLRERLVVRDTAIIGQELAPVPAADKQRCLHAWRVEDLFADVARALADTTARLWELEYDATYGFPRGYRIVDGDPYVGLRGRCARVCGVRVESFVPAP